MSKNFSGLCFVSAMFALSICLVGLVGHAYENAVGGSCTYSCIGSHWVLVTNQANQGFTCPVRAGFCFPGTPNETVEAIPVVD